MLAMLALKNILDASGKKVFLTPAPGESFKTKFGKIFSHPNNLELPQKIKIKIPKSSAIEELKYEEDENFFSVLISPKNKIEPAELLIEKSPREMDASFCFFEGEAGWKKIDPSVSRPSPEKTIYVHGGEKTLAEKINEIHGVLNDSRPIPQDTATLLFASLVCETENFQKQNREIFALANKLLGGGANQKTVDEIFISEKKIGTAQILGRALARTTLESDLKTSWTFLTKHDFEKTGFVPSKENLVFLLKKTRSNIMPAQGSVVCYEDNGAISSLIYNEDKYILGRLAFLAGSSLESKHFFVSGLKNFSEAEVKIRQLLKQAISDRMKEYNGQKQ